MNKKLLSLYGLKWNPFAPDLPTEALLQTPRIESFCWRIEQTIAREGGFGLVTGEVGTGKSVAMRLLAGRLERLRDVVVGELCHPQSNLADFYREMGDVFGVPLKPHNRWGGFRALRDRWCAHIESTLIRPILLIDEVQQMPAAVLTEIRLLSSMRFDSRQVLACVLAGDNRLANRFRSPELLPLGSRIRCRLVMDYASRDELLTCLEHLLEKAGSPALMTDGLKETLADHATGNYRTLSQLSNDLLVAACEREAPKLDEKLFFEVFNNSSGQSKKRKKR